MRKEKDMKEGGQFNYLFPITTLFLYEIVAFLTIYTHRFCDLWLYPCGLQYIIFCFIVPVLTVILWLWKAVLLKKSKFLKRLFCFVILAVPFVSLGTYLFLRPIVLDFTNRSDVLIVKNALKTACIKEENRLNTVIDYYDTERKCDAISLTIHLYVNGKVITKKHFVDYVTDTKIKYKDWPYYSTTSCENIARDEFWRCKSKKDIDAGLCSCMGDIVAFIIKKNPDVYFSDKQINSRIQTIRMEALAYCDKEQKADKLKTYPFDSKIFCDNNKI